MLSTDRWRLPEGPLRASVFTTGLVALAGSLVLGWVGRVGLGAGELYPLKAGVLFSTIMMVVLGKLQGRHPFPRFGPANQTTTARAALVALLAGLIGEPPFPAAAAAVGLVGLLVTTLDGVDGWLSRRSRVASRFGARFDMEVDGLLIMVLAALAWQYGKAGLWVLLSGLLRYLFLAVGLLLPWLSRPLYPSWRRQAICVAQSVGLALAILPVVTPAVSRILLAAALLALGYSFLVDVIWLWRHAAGTRAEGRRLSPSGGRVVVLGAPPQRS